MLSYADNRSRSHLANPLQIISMLRVKLKDFNSRLREEERLSKSLHRLST